MVALADLPPADSGGSGAGTKRKADDKPEKKKGGKAARLGGLFAGKEAAK
jgi:hypothetical protein